jgi:hypothetical protein
LLASRSQAVFFIRHLFGGKAKLDREAKPAPQPVPANSRQMRSACIGQPVGDVAMRFEPDMDEPRGRVERAQGPHRARFGARHRGGFGEQFADMPGHRRDAAWHRHAARADRRLGGLSGRARRRCLFRQCDRPESGA